MSNSATTVSTQRISDLLCTAFEGGVSYWSEWPSPDAFPEGQSRADFEFFHIELPLVEGGSVKFRDAEEPDEEFADADGYYRLNLEKVTKGLKVMAAEYPYHWGNFVSENDDADTGDCFLQCCIFGRIIYG